MRLGRAPESINIGQLVRMIEQGSTLVECFGSDNQCVITPACQLKSMFAEALDSFFTSLEQYTLADLIGDNRRQELSRLLATDAR